MVFSIIIPTHNAEATLGRSLESICQQTFNSFEILIIDNKSTDQTLSIVRDFQKRKRVNIKVYSDSDKGIYDAMNKGIRLSTGEWIYFLGSDDTLYENEVLNSIHQIIQLDSKLDVVYGNVTSPLFGGTYAGEFNYQMLMQRNICHQAIFFRKTVFKRIGGFTLKYPINADWEHNLKWFFHRKIHNKYIDLIICDYGTVGISSTKKDLIFKANKEKILLKYCWRKMTYQQIIAYLKNFIISKLKLQ